MLYKKKQHNRCIYYLATVLLISLVIFLLPSAAKAETISETTGPDSTDLETTGFETTAVETAASETAAMASEEDASPEDTASEEEVPAPSEPAEEEKEETEGEEKEEREETAKEEDVPENAGAAEEPAGFSEQPEVPEEPYAAEDEPQAQENELLPQNTDNAPALETAEDEAVLLKTENPVINNGIPVLYLTIDPDEFQAVSDSPDHSYRSYSGSIRIEIPEGYTGEYGDIDAAAVSTELALEFIRGRGHSTWRTAKKPFKIKLEKSTDLLGMGKNKHWTILSNPSDHSLLRNRISLYMGEELGLEFTPQMVSVDFVVNGEYMGSYVLGEEIRIGKSRVNIDEIDPDATEGEEITGGYLLAMYPYDDEPEANTFTTSRGVPFLMESPVFDDSDPDEQAAQEQYDYITDYLQKTEDAIFGDGFMDENGVSYTEYMDIESAARYWWVQVACQNIDAYHTSSTYLYKKRDGKLYWGPIWDMDFTMRGVYEVPNPFNEAVMIWLDHLRENDPQFQDALRRVWDEFDTILSDITKPGGVLDRYAEEIRASWQMNYDRWFAGTANAGVDFDKNIELIREVLETRRIVIENSIDELLTKVDHDTDVEDEEQETSGSTEDPGGSDEKTGAPEKEEDPSRSDRSEKTNTEARRSGADEEGKTKTSPAVGDESSIFLWILLCAVSLVCVTFLSSIVNEVKE